MLAAAAGVRMLIKAALAAPVAPVAAALAVPEMEAHKQG
jgi:hypothetical protein